MERCPGKTSRFAIAALAAALLLALAPIAAAQEALEGRYKRGALLGSGQYKSVYAVEGHPELALGIVGWQGLDDALVDEKKALDTLARHGVPAAKVLALGTFEGKPAYVLERYATGTRAPDWGTRHLDLLNENTIADLKTIERALTAARLEVEDLQFLVKENGHIVIADPLSVKEGVGTSDATRRALHGLVKLAQEAIATRHLEAAIRRMPGAEDPKLAAWFARRAVTLEPGDAAGKAALTEALAHFLESGETTSAARAVASALRAGTFALRLFPSWEPLAANEVHLNLGGVFPRVALELLRAGAAKLGLGPPTGAEPLDAAFLRAKHAPATLDPAAPGGSPDALERLAGEATARAIRERSARLERASETPGLSGGVERLRDRVRDRSRDKVEVPR